MAESRLDETLSDQIDPDSREFEGESEDTEFSMSRKIPYVPDDDRHTYRWMRHSFGRGGVADVGNVAQMTNHPTLKYTIVPSKEFPKLAFMAEKLKLGGQNHDAIILGDLVLTRCDKAARKRYDDWMVRKARDMLISERQKAAQTYKRSGGYAESKDSGIIVERDEVELDNVNLTR